MRTYTNFNVIDIVDEGSLYPTLLEIGWANESLAMINLNKCVMTLRSAISDS